MSDPQVWAEDEHEPGWWTMRGNGAEHVPTASTCRKIISGAIDRRGRVRVWAQEAQRGGMEQQMQAAGVAQHSRSECDGGAEWATQSGLCAGKAPRAGAPSERGAGYDAGGQRSGGGRRAHARHEGNVQGNRLGERNAHGAKREGAQYATGGRAASGEGGAARGRAAVAAAGSVHVYRIAEFELQRSRGGPVLRGNAVEAPTAITSPQVVRRSQKAGLWNEWDVKFLRPIFNAAEDQEQPLCKKLLGQARQRNGNAGPIEDDPRRKKRMRSGGDHYEEHIQVP
ncbi:hypothetical protein K438DRAFT_2076996 [Mycena galopus ATCC 62051]|nr:hypothetical protein K438DRAFT_2076996 [Mycena galopus ATCC 62051]